MTRYRADDKDAVNEFAPPHNPLQHDTYHDKYHDMYRDIMVADDPSGT